MRVNIADQDIVALGYSHDFADSLFGNFITRDQIDFSIIHAFNTSFQGSAGLRVSLDRYSDLPPLDGQQSLSPNRFDVPLLMFVRGDYELRSDFKVGGSVSFLANISNYSALDLVSGGINDANYLQLQAGLQAVYTY